MSLEAINAEWDELSKEYNKLEVGEFFFLFLWNHVFFKFLCVNFFLLLKDVSNEYHDMLEKLEQLQQKCMKDIAHQRYRINQIASNFKK